MIPHYRRMIRARLIPLLPALVCLAGCRNAPAAPPQTTEIPPPAVTFRDVTKAAGIDFVQTNGATGRKLLPETMGSGCAFLDYDNDGWLDILLVNGTDWWNPRSKSLITTMHLYRNDHHGHFTDVTHEAGLDVEMYGMGVAVGDYDNDGFDDIYVTGVGGCRLFHNESAESKPSARTSERPNASPRHFRDVTASAGVKSPGWTTSATWVDYDRDGRLDLFVCHYVQWTPQTNRYFSLDNVHRSYSTPEQYPGESCRLYHNEGNGRFTDVSVKAGIYNAQSKALGVIAFDFDQDGWQDILVANDTQPNFLFHNQGDGTFKEVALETGLAVSEMGRAKAGMGVDVADERQDGMESVLITNFSGEQATLYRRDASGHYQDEAARSGIGNATQLYLGFGALFLDYDGDGWQDIFVANGHIQGDIDTRRTGVVYREPSLLLRNTGGGLYADVTTSSGRDVARPRIARGAAWGDYDNDGHPDILISSNFGDPSSPRNPDDGRARLLHNQNLTGNHWLRIQLEGVRSNRDAYGARVRVKIGERTLTQTLKASSSYLSQSDRRLLFGLGAATQADNIEIQWPNGEVRSLGPQSANHFVHVREGEPSRVD